MINYHRQPDVAVRIAGPPLEWPVSNRDLDFIRMMELILLSSINSTCLTVAVGLVSQVHTLVEPVEFHVLVPRIYKFECFF